MKLLNPEREWKNIKHQLFYNKPNVAPFSETVTRRRELLLIAQCLLSDYESAKNHFDKEFTGKLYKITMNLYYNWRISSSNT